MRYAFKTYRKIDVYVDGVYSHSTNAHKTLRAAIRAVWDGVQVATIGAHGPELRLVVGSNRVTASFSS